MSGTLTEEQLKRIEENKRKALAKRAQKITAAPSVQALSPPKNSTIYSTVSINNPSGLYNDNKIKVDGNKQPAAVAVSVQTGGADSAVTSSKHLGFCNRTETVSGNSGNNQGSGAHSVALRNLPQASVSAAERIEQNRLKALARRAERLNKSPAKADQGTSALGTSGPSSSVSCAKINAGLQQNLNKDTVGVANKQSQYGNAPVQRDGGLFAQKSTISSSSNTGRQASAAAGSSVKELPGSLPGLHTSNNWNAFGAMMQGTVKGNCVLVTRERFEVTVGYCAPLIELFKTMETKLYDAVSKKWTFKLSEYNKFMSAVKALKPSVDIEPLPPAILKAFAAQLRGENPVRDIPMANLSRVDPSLVNSLMSFQRTGVNFGVYKNGRVLIADDMGLGKTIQAICLACYYRSDWPVLVVVPSSVRYDWAQQFRRWVPSIDPDTIRVVVTGKDSCTSGLITIISYDLVARRADELKQRGFKVVIVDESHLLKNYKTARCKAAIPLLQNARRVFLLSGTPALSRPSELYTQISAVCPFMLKFHDFGVRYCDGKQLQWGWDFSGSSNMCELQLFMEETVMIRRLKKEVLSELPDKIRHMVMLDPSSIRISKELKSASKVMSSAKLKSTDQTGALLDFFHKSGSAKLNAIKNYVDDLLEQEKKFLIFAHHGDVLDGIEETVKSKIDNKYMRIDGRTGSEQRSINCGRFQSKDSIRVAILSITAANAGLNLSAANLVVFAELFWNPGILVQAEDRAHRIGQQDSVSVQYLVATGTSDDTIWPMIQRKLDVLGKAGLTRDNFSNAETTRLKDQQQLDIEKFLEESFSEDFNTPTDEEEEFQQRSPTKVIKQQSILKYTSPVKSMDANSNLTLDTKEPTVKKRKVEPFQPPYAKGER